MKAYWIAAGIGVLVTLAGAVIWAMSDHQLGLILFLGGIVVAGMGVVMRLASAYMPDDKAKQ